MNTSFVKSGFAVSTRALLVAVALNSLADEATVTAPPEKSYVGMVVSIDPKEHVLTVKSSVFSQRSFNLGDNCQVVMRDNKAAAAGDLRMGQKVSVKYQDAHGVLIASRVSQVTMRREGMVTSIEPDKHLLLLKGGQRIQIADDCKVVLRDGKLGSFADIKVGNHVTVTYEKPGDTTIARQIAQTSIAFTGTLTAIDLDERTVKARTTFSTKKFNLADNCAVVINGRPDGKLSDLKPNDRLVFEYDEIDGVNVVNRIAPVTEASSTNSVATAAPTAE